MNAKSEEGLLAKKILTEFMDEEHHIYTLILYHILQAARED